MASSSSAAAGRRATTLLDLPPDVLGGRIIAALDAASRLALFRSSHALARLVLVHAPGSKQVTHRFSSSSGSGRWSPTLADLVGSRWQPLPSPLGLELRITSSAGFYGAKPPLPSRLPPATIRQHTSHLHLERWQLTASALAAWQLHSPTLWPHLQHLTINNAGDLDRPPTSASLRQLRPIPRLASFSLHGYVADGLLEAALPLVANAQRLRLTGVDSTVAARVVAGLPRLTHASVGGMDEEMLQALLRHPTVQHVTVGSLEVAKDRSQLPCRWRTLTVLQGMGLGHLPNLPVAQLERLTIHGRLDARYDGSGAGLPALQQLHAEGRLALRPTEGDDGLVREWRLPPGARVIGVWATADTTTALARLVVEAGQGPDGINCLCTSAGSLPISTLRDEVAPLLQQSGRITTLCVDVWHDTPLEWCSGLLGALPLCVVSVRVVVRYWAEQHARALVQGGVASLTHPVTLTLLHDGAISEECEAELRQVAAGESAASQQPLLALEVVRRG